MNYQHAFHAGNFADVHKHAVLALILVHLRLKPAAFRVIDSHAGAGRYDLYASESTRGGEWHGGIQQIWNAYPPPHAPPLERQGGDLGGDEAQVLLAPYLQVVRALNPEKKLRIYPGSPVIAQSLMRSQDRLIACEFEPRSAAVLKAVLRGDSRVKVLTIDGWMALGATVPPKERRGIVLVDPPFEGAADFMRLSSTLAVMHRKWPSGTYMLWYPIKDRAAPDALAGRLRSLALPKVLRCEVTLAPPQADSGLIGSGLIVVNPPFTLESDLRLLLPTLGKIFSSTAAYRIDWLASDR